MEPDLVPGPGISPTNPDHLGLGTPGPKSVFALGEESVWRTLGWFMLNNKHI